MMTCDFDSDEISRLRSLIRVVRAAIVAWVFVYFVVFLWLESLVISYFWFFAVFVGWTVLWYLGFVRLGDFNAYLHDRLIALEVD